MAWPTGKVCDHATNSSRIFEELQLGTSTHHLTSPPTPHPPKLLLPFRLHLPRLHYLLQSRYLPITSPTDLHFLAEYATADRAWVAALAHFALAVIVGAADVKAVHVGGQDAADEEEAVDQAICLGAADEEDGEGRD